MPSAMFRKLRQLFRSFSETAKIYFKHISDYFDFESGVSNKKTTTGESEATFWGEKLFVAVN